MKEKGFSLIEVIIVILITAIIAGVAGMMLSAGANSYVTARPLIPSAIKANTALDKLMRELRSANSINGPLSSTSLSFRNHSGQTIIFHLNGSVLSRCIDSTANCQPLLNNVSAFSFNYFQNDSELTVAGSADTTRLVIANITISEEGNNYSLLAGTTIRRLI